VTEGVELDRGEGEGHPSPFPPSAVSVTGQLSVYGTRFPWPRNVEAGNLY